MNTPALNLAFPHKWTAEILPSRPVILPARHYVYPAQVEEVERGALELLVKPQEGAPFLATCALGFRDTVVPSGIWSAPNPHEICAVSGGYAYIINTTSPDQFTMVPWRPVLQVLSAQQAGVLLFVGSRGIVAWGAEGEEWQSPKLSDEGVSITTVEGQTLRGLGWNMLTDRETPFTLNLHNGVLMDS